jgi:Fic family protein
MFSGELITFINGNGRTARAASYFTLCLAVGGLLSGKKILPELIRENRQEYCDALQLAHDSFSKGNLDLSALHALVSRLLDEQMKSAPAAIGGTPIVWPPAANSPSTAGTQGVQGQTP